MKNYEKVVSTNEGKLEFYPLTALGIKSKQVLFKEPVTYVTPEALIKKVSNHKSMKKGLKTVRTDRYMIHLEEIKSFYKAAELLLEAIANLEVRENQLITVNS